MASRRSLPRAKKLLAQLQSNRKAEGIRIVTTATAADEPSNTNDPYPEEKYGDRQMTAGMYYREAITPTLDLSVVLQHVLCNTKSEFQEIQIIETVDFGKTLVLDGKTQSAARDEYVYHECLVHPSMILHHNPKSVYIGGGGELATAREVLRHKSVEKVIMVDLDEEVVKLSRKYLPEWGNGAMDDSRLEVYYEDAKAFLENYDGTFDVIVMDIADPIEAGPGYILYTQEFYKFVISKLNPGGVLVTQAGPAGFLTHHECFSVIHKTMGSVFDHVAGYSVEIPSFGCPWGFLIAFNNSQQIKSTLNNSQEISPEIALQSLSVDHVNSKINERIKDVMSKPLRFYDGVSHLGIFGLPKYVRDNIRNEERVMTIDNPIFMY